MLIKILCQKKEKRSIFTKIFKECRVYTFPSLTGKTLQQFEGL
jgi:hypothetical protein